MANDWRTATDGPVRVAGCEWCVNATAADFFRAQLWESPGGQIARRASGLPRRAEVAAAVALAAAEGAP